MSLPTWQTNLSNLLRDNSLKVKTENGTSINEGVKYVLSPPIEFKNLKGLGCPISNEKSKCKGWISPSDPEIQKLLKSLKRYICEKLEVEFDEQKPVALTTFNYPNSAHRASACYSTCEKANEGDKPLCLRTWVYENIHKTKGKFNKNVIDKPWFNLPPNHALNLTEVAGKITSVYVSPNNVKLWCVVDFGVASASNSDKFSDDEFMSLISE